MATNAKSYQTGVESSSIPNFPHFAVLLDQEHMCVESDVGPSERVVTKAGVTYIWFESEDELKHWIRHNEGVSYKAIRALPLEVRVDIQLIEGND